MSILDQDKLNAFTRHTHIEVKGAPGGPLKGLTFGVKDIYDVAGVKTGFGSPAWLDSHEVATKNAAVVDQLLKAGASIVGKTHTEEMAWSINGINAHYGRPINVKAEGRVCGGSSSGSVSAVAGGLCDFALGSDTGGSIRLPASYTGIYGLRPTHGRLSLEGVLPLAPSFDVAGWFARDAQTYARIGKVLLQGGDWNAKPRALLIAEDMFALLGGREKEALQASVKRIAALYGEPRPVKIADRPLRECFELYRIIQAAEVWKIHAAWVEKYKPSFGPGIHERMYGAAKSDPAEVEKAKAAREKVSTYVAELLKNGAMIILPTVPSIAPKIDMSQAEADNFRGTAMSLLSVSVLARTPQISLPLANLDGCPLGISIMGARGTDEMLIEAARKIGA
ncbi:MAG TPA: amidase [Xanthobacteraceae bacterium]|nr:amidase [Xanthobacteraceae bacterium]